MTGNKKLFLSAVNSEFRADRTLLAQDLKRPTLDVAVEDDFIVTDGTTLEKLDDYIRACDGVIHLIGKATGAVPEEPAVAALLKKYPDFADRFPPLAAELGGSQPGFSYTQWEAYLALYHRRPLFIYRPEDFESDDLRVPRGEQFVVRPAEMQSQTAHYQRIAALGHDRGQFLTAERLSSKVLRDLVDILPRLQPTITVPPTRLRHTAGRLIGRDEELARLDAAWNDGHENVVVIRAFGGMGKTALVATWMAELALKNWRGAERVFDWTFYSQGTNDQRAASSDAFFVAALKAFGDREPMPGSPWDRGARLARLVSKERCLLVLDGMEPLQYPPGPMDGKLKDAAIEALLKGLAGQNIGLCVVTTREKIPDIQQHYGRTAHDLELAALSDLAGAALLHHHGAVRAGARHIALDDDELQATSREVRGHGLTLQLVGQYLRLVEGGDILKRDTVHLAEADQEYQNDATRPYGHAFKAMEAYENWFQREGREGKRQVAILRVLGLFDRPASKSCLDALCKKPVITGLTEPLIGLTPRDWRLLTGRLAGIDLIILQADGSLDAHPLLREYFGRRLREKQPKAWQAAHRRLYEHLFVTTKEGNQPTLEDLQPLLQAVVHGCRAGLEQDALDKVYLTRILRGGENYSKFKLGALGSDLGALVCFFETPWSAVAPAIREADQAWMLHEAAFSLRALGRLAEALDPMRAGLGMQVGREDWMNAAVGANNLSELELGMGDVPGAIRDAEQSVAYADRSGDAFQRMGRRTTHANAMHQSGRRTDAEARFREAEQMQVVRQTVYPLLYSVSGFEYCDLLLSEAEREAAKVVGRGTKELLAVCRAVRERALQTSTWAEQFKAPLLTSALDELTLGRAGLYSAALSPESQSPSSFDLATSHLEIALYGLRRAGQQVYLPRALLTHAWLRAVTGSPQAAAADLNEAWEIAERGPMSLFQADIHLYRARLFFREPHYPWESPQHDLAEARRLIFKHGYLRRKEELEDAEAAINPQVTREVVLAGPTQE